MGKTKKGPPPCKWRFFDGKRMMKLGLKPCKVKVYSCGKSLWVLASGNDSQILRFPNLFVEYDPMEI